MKPEYCPGYVGVACVDGTCPVALREEETGYASPHLPCDDCWLYKGCEDCACLGTDMCEKAREGTDNG